MTNHSNISIGIIGGSKPLISLMEEALKSFPSFNSICKMVQNEAEIIESTTKLMKKSEVIVFTEYHLFKKAQQKLEFTIPVHYVPLMGTGLYRALFKVKTLHGLKRLSVDTIEEKYVNQILTELKESGSTVYFFEEASFSPIKDIISFHVKNYESTNTVAITGIPTVAQELTELNIPNELTTPTHQDLIVSLERALLSTETRRNKESQVVFGLVNIDNFRKKAETYQAEHEVQQLKLNIHKVLLDYTKQLEGHLIDQGGGEYSFFTTRGIFERETRGYKFIPILQDMEKKFGVTLSIGVGFGRTAADAGFHARVALRRSQEIGGNVCYIVREDRSVLGPVDITSPMNYENYNLAITDPELLQKAEKAGMSAAYMSRLMAQVSRFGKFEYTAQELASILNITIRSAHRILLKWMDADIVEIVGEEKIRLKGRPRRIYKLTFLADYLGDEERF